MHLIGIDAGGTKTVCQLADRTGRVLAASRGPGATLHVMPDADVARALGGVIADVLGTQGVAGLAAVCIGMGGVDRPGEADRVRGVLASLARGARVLVVSDALIALEAGAPGAAGVVIIAGTGSVAFGRDAAGHAARAGGWGHLLADEGSGYWLARQALRAVVRAHDGRGPATLLTGHVLAHWRVTRPPDLVQHIYAADPRPTTTASLAPVIQTAADAGDEVARGILEQASEELAGAGLSVARQLALDRGPVVLSGSVFRAVPAIREHVSRRLAQELPAVSAHLLDVEPALGAVRLASALAAGTLRLPAYPDAASAAGRQAP
ncbi:MAG TPA: BadF/BadG/BcrA/BcrD ATPase family protein [Vicinamibacterales bacterium]|nr:BadF/BadG/BcrA/BcrD ATPase family protein [Vicinamibacterales bacterium]